MGVRVTYGVLAGYVYLVMIMIMMMVGLSSASVVLIGSNVSLYFQDMEADFSKLNSNGVCGRLYISEPVDACSPLRNKVEKGGNCTYPFALIKRGVCSFEDKVRMAQKAGFKAAIIYDYEDSNTLVSMAGNSAGIKIPAVFISKATGGKLMTYAGVDIEVWILPGYDYTTWSIMAISFMSLLAMSAILATCFFVRRHQTRRERPRRQVREFHGMSHRLVKAIPTLIFTAVTEDNCTSSTCAICLEDYMIGDKLRILPCCHKFHAICVDSWLTTWRTFCPICKRDARTSTGEPPASESTPLISSISSSVSSSQFSSFRSTARSSAIPIASPSHRQLSYSSSMGLSRSSVDLRSLSSQRSQFYTPDSMGYASSSSLTARFMSPHVRSPSLSYTGSSIRQLNTLHYSASAQSLHRN